MTAEEFLFSKYPLVSPEWFDDNKLTQEMIKMMEEYAEKVIEERMPTEEEIKKRQKDKGDYLYELGYPAQAIAKYKDAIKETALWINGIMKGGKK